MGTEGLGFIQHWFVQKAWYFSVPQQEIRSSLKVPSLPGSVPSIHLCMNEWKTQRFKTKGFYSKNAKYKKKIRSLLFPCTVYFTQIKPAGCTLLKAQPQRGSGRHTTPELSYVQSADPRPTPASSQGGPWRRGLQQLSHRSPNTPASVTALP